MIDWENKTAADQVDMAIVKAYFTKNYHEWLQYSKANEGQTKLNKSGTQSYKKQKPRYGDNAMASIFAQIETGHQEQMESLKEAMYVANERWM